MKNLAGPESIMDERDLRMVSALDRVFGMILAVLLTCSVGVGVAYWVW